MRYWIFAVVIAVAALALWQLGTTADTKVAYQTQALGQGDIESVVNTAGTTKAVVTVQVGTEVSGLITELYVDFNADVSAGQAIAKLDDRSYVARMRQAEADVVMAQASLAQQQANLLKAQTELNRADRAWQRQQELMRQKLTNQTELDNALASYETAKAQLSLAKAQIQSADAQLLQRNAQLEQAQLDLDRTVIRSPVNGTVIDRQVDIGQTVAASLSAPTLFTIAQDLSQMQIEADVDEADIGKVQQGQSVRFQVDAYPNRPFNGTVSQVRKAATNSNNVVTYKVIIDAPNQQQLLLPGMTANINIVLGRKSGVLRLPNVALRFKPAGSTASSAAQRPDMAQTLIDELKLGADKAAKVRSLFAESAAAMRQARDNPAAGPAGDARERFARERQKQQNALQSILSEQEYQHYQQLLQKRRDSRDNDSGTVAEVWRKNAAGEPERVSVRVGLSNDEYSELLPGELSPGDSVIVRAVRVE